MKLKDSIRYLKGVGPRKEKNFANLGIYTIEDLLEYYPRDYEDQRNFAKLGDAISDETYTFIITLNGLFEERRIRPNLTLTSFLVEDDTDKGLVTFFNANYIKKTLKKDETYIVRGKVKRYKGQVQITSPKIEKMNDENFLGHISPIYSLKYGISNNDIIKPIKQILDLNLFKENLPQSLIKKYKLMDKNTAIKNIHCPESKKDYIDARNRLVFEELLKFQLAIFMLKSDNAKENGISFNVPNDIYEFINKLPFKLTEGQNKVIYEIFDDLKSNKRMNRLLQGDVGSGKTIIAIIAMYLAYLNRYQSTIMAPTEILARQHLENFRKLFDPLGIKVELLVGSTTQKNKNRILSGIETGEIDMLIGTHSLIEENVNFRNLGLNITDEQHRFGVKQRENLNKKNKMANILVMSATPIPRTLALILYGDLSISTIDTLPPNRKKIETIAINKSMLNKALVFIKNEISKGRQIYVICPLIEDNEKFNLNSVEKVYEDLKNNVYSNFEVELLHGKMKVNEKENIMRRFEKGEINILVSTTVVEVGVNVPNASVILIYNAERFGLAQLHQLRGRVGRGAEKSYCILFNDSKSKVSWERMKVMTNSTDGFYIANKDLELRGSGEMFGIKQSGINELKISEFPRDLNILKFVQEEAKEIIKNNKNNYKELYEDISRIYKFEDSILN